VITARGKTFIKRYLAGQAGSAVGAISVGIGATAATVNDERLQFEFARVPVNVIDYDFVTNELIFKGTLDEEVEGKIYEVGIWTDESNAAPGSQESNLLTSFDSASEDWSVETFDSAITRIGTDSLKQTPASSGTSSSVLTGILLDLVDYSSLDTFVLAYNVDNANTANVKVRLRTDASNYYEFTVTSPTAGYKFASFTKGSATVVGTPSWADINEIEIRTTATGGGSASVEFEGLRIEDVDSVAPEYGLVARFIPAAPETKVEGIVKDIEFALPVTV
jgi:hypothetical protein